MYTVKGQDEKEYGPVDAAQLRLWLTQGRLDANSLIRAEGAADWRPLAAFPELAQAAPPPLRPVAPPPPDSGLATLIPYRNAPALTAYYLGVFSLIPCIGFFLGLAAVVVGIFGLIQAKKNPAAKGKVHAWVGIILGALVVLGHLIFFIFGLVAASSHN